MITIKRELSERPSRMIVSFDLEWTKNFRVKNGNRPFCFSFVYFNKDVDITKAETDFDFGLHLQFVENRCESNKLVSDANIVLANFINKASVIIGHQLSSDIGVLINFASDTKSCNNFELLRTRWTKRRSQTSSFLVFDTRYDMDSFLRNKSRRLVDVCQETKLNVTQPELTSSMTKMQNTFFINSDKYIMEKLAVLNIRHSLSAGLLYCLFSQGRRLKKELNVNSILRNNLRASFEYVNSKEFKKLG